MLTSATALLLLTPTSPAHAHEADLDPLPTQPGLRLGGALAGLVAHANDRWPTPAWPGVMTNGSAASDMRGGLRLEHATLQAALRAAPIGGVSPGGLQVVAGWHDRDRVHTEAARWIGQWRWGEEELVLSAGRDRVRMGAVIDSAGHFDRFSQAPLASRAVLNELWLDDGVSATWRRAPQDGLRAIELGLWRGRGFPGSGQGPWVPTLHLHGGWAHLDAHAFASHLAPTGRGAAAQTAGTVGHVHGNLDCSQSLQQRVCFDGQVDVWGGSLQWAPDASALTLSIAGLMRRERGSLYASSGTAHIDTTVQGVWADAVWQPAPTWSLAARLERLVPRNAVQGVGATALSEAAGLANGAPAHRVTVAVLKDLDAAHPNRFQLSTEAGQERQVPARNTHVALRFIWREAALGALSW